MALYRSPEYQTSFESVDLSVRENKVKIDSQNGGSGVNFGFLIETILATFNLQVVLILPTNFRVDWPFYSEDGGHRTSLDFRSKQF